MHMPCQEIAYSDPLLLAQEALTFIIKYKTLKSTNKCTIYLHIYGTI